MERLELAFRVFLPSFFVTFILITGPLGVAAFKRRYGLDPEALVEPDPVMELGESCRNLLLAVILLMTGAYAVDPSVQEYLGPFSYLELAPVRWTGVSLLIVSLVLVRVSQIQMGSSWRFGFDRASPSSRLITTGLFSLSRNPIYLGLTAMAVGLFLALPNAVTLAVVVATLLLLQVRIRLEEEFLLVQHGEAYTDYRRRTPRWLLRLRTEA